MLCLLLPALVGALAFAPVVGFGFVYDDHWTVEGNRDLDRPLPVLLRAALLLRDEARDIADSTRPSMIASLHVDRSLFGSEPSGYHLHSLALYAGTCALAALFLLMLSRRPRVALIGGMVFALAPVHAEVVSAINYREDLIAAVGVLAALAWLCAPRVRPDSLDGAVWAATAWAIGLLGKESAVSLAPMLLALILVKRDALSWLRARRVTLIALGVTLGIWGGWRLAVRLKGLDDVPVAPPRAALELVTATARYEVDAALRSLVPIVWSPEYAHEGKASALWLLPLLGLVGTALLLARRPALRLPATGILLGLLAPLATSPLVGPINERADRYLFLGVLGGALVWGFVLDRLMRRISRVGRPLLLSALGLPLCLLAQTAARPWTNDFSLWSEATRRAPTATRAWVGLSQAQRRKGDLDAADASIDRALALDPQSKIARVTRVYNLITRGELDTARRELEQIRTLGGERQRGMPRATRCAALESPREAAACLVAP
jgi:protein O-mannosyl-transferase